MSEPPFLGAVFLEPGSELWEKILGKKDSGDDSDSDAEMEPKEEEHDELMKQYDAYLKQWRDSEGFDLDFVPDGLQGGPYIVNDVEDCVPRYLKLANACAKFAIDHQNEHKSSKLELVGLVKFNVDFSWEEDYYLTFRAKDGRDGSVSVYQALVAVPNPFIKEEGKEGKTEVRLFREKQTNSANEIRKGVESLSMDVARDAAELST